MKSAAPLAINVSVCFAVVTAPLAHKGCDVVCELFGVFHTLVQCIKPRGGGEVRALSSEGQMSGLREHAGERIV